jgi:hypothetical protein
VRQCNKLAVIQSRVVLANTLTDPVMWSVAGSIDVSLSRVRREENVSAPYVVNNSTWFYVRRFPKKGIFLVDNFLLDFWPETTL